MPRQTLEVADIFRDHGPAWRAAQAGHLSLGQLKVMSAIEHCRTPLLGGHVEQCEACGHIQIAYNSCRNRHCPKCQGAAAQQWLAEREADLLPVEYYHVVFTLPAPIADIAYQNKRVVYGLLMAAAAETLLTIAADPKHLGARVGLTAVLHTWGSAMTHHPHVHCIVTGGGLSPDGERWVACRPGFFLPVRVLSRLFRRRLLEQLSAAHQAGDLAFFGEQAHLAAPEAFTAWLTPLRRQEWVVYAKAPFAGPEAVLGYLSRYTHRVAIANSRLIADDDQGITFTWKDYRASGRHRRKRMTLAPEEFMRRFLLHVLPSGFHRIRHYGLLANAARVRNLEHARALLITPTNPVLAVPVATEPAGASDPSATPARRCPCCGAPLRLIETFTRGQVPRAVPSPRSASP
ncbi:IS91 family transposase [Thiocapsa marina]|uniref:Transposase n=1 Tax=Thiocapsa marina 5811 TaxID=768671 RepID=F9UC19_9GAMM|nr:IS91 family transposase [Thiocapsa marina]EGV18487.1 transposase [Thiocapsa marina 5811]NCA72434.1 IS91 family transposase [Sphingobacteriia bacterium]